MHAFVPWLKHKRLPGVLAYGQDLPLALVVRGKLRQRVKHLAVQALAPKEHPLIPGQAVRHHNAAEKVAVIQRHRLLEMIHARAAQPAVGVRVLGAGEDMRVEQGHVDLHVCSRVALDGIAGDEQAWRISRRIADGLSQGRQGVAQAFARNTFGNVRP